MSLSDHVEPGKYPESEEAALVARRGFWFEHPALYLVWKRATERNFTALPVNRLASAIWLSAWKPAV